MAYASIKTTPLAKAMGVSYQAVKRVEDGLSKAFNASNNAIAARALGVDPDWLANGESATVVPKEHAGERDEEFTHVRRVAVKFSNGTGKVIYYEEDDPPLAFRADFLRSAGIPQGDAVVVEAEGISNEPKILDGSIVLVNSSDRERLNGDFFAYRYDGELMIKRLQELPGIGILATSENPNFKPKQRVYSHGDDFEVIGRAIWTGAML